MKTIETEEDYNKALEAIDALLDCEEGSKEAAKLEELSRIAEAYEEENYKIDPVHPGEILKEFLEPRGLSAQKLAENISMPLDKVIEIINGRASICAETALLLARYFGLSASFWIKMQSRYDELSSRQT